MGTNLVGPVYKKETTTTLLPAAIVTSQQGHESDGSKRMMFNSPTNGATYFIPQGIITQTTPSVVLTSGGQTVTIDSGSMIASAPFQIGAPSASIHIADNGTDVDVYVGGGKLNVHDTANVVGNLTAANYNVQPIFELLTGTTQTYNLPTGFTCANSLILMSSVIQNDLTSVPMNYGAIGGTDFAAIALVPGSPDKISVTVGSGTSFTWVYAILIKTDRS